MDKISPLVVAKQGERYLVLEAAGGRAPFVVDLSESFGSEAEAVAAAKRESVPGGPALVVLGFRFCATIATTPMIPRSIAEARNRRLSAPLRSIEP